MKYFLFQQINEDKSNEMPPVPSGAECLDKTDLADHDHEETIVSYLDQIQPHKAYNKAKALFGDKENKFTSTLRRLSTVRKKNKCRRKASNESTGSRGDPSDVLPEEGQGVAGGGVRPASTTSRESETEGGVTSGYFR